MTTSANKSGEQARNFSWEALYQLLWCVVQVWVYSAHLSAWQGQVEEIIAEIVHETIARVYERLQKAERGDADPVNSIEAMSRTVARHYFIDLLRKDRRLVHFTQISHSPVIEQDWVDLLEKVHDAVFYESLFDSLAPEIIKLPKKQKQAFLVDLANHTDFSMSMPLQRAFLKVGVRLQDYQQPVPDDPIERSRHSSLLSIARKRIANLPCVKQYILTA